MQPTAWPLLKRLLSISITKSAGGDYPLSIQELVRIYLNMRRRMSLNTNRMVKIASRRNIQQDIRHIVEHRCRYGRRDGIRQ